MTVHAFVSPKADGTDATLVKPSNWNAAHSTPNQQNAIAADVVIVNANQFYDGPSLANLPAGTWLVVGHVTCEDPAVVGGVHTAKLWDGATVFATAEGSNNPAGQPLELTLAAVIVQAAPATIRISVASSVANGRITATPTTNGAGGAGTMSRLMAIRLV